MRKLLIPEPFPMAQKGLHQEGWRRCVLYSGKGLGVLNKGIAPLVGAEAVLQREEQFAL